MDVLESVLLVVTVTEVMVDLGKFELFCECLNSLENDWGKLNLAQLIIKL